MAPDWLITQCTWGEMYMAQHAIAAEKARQAIERGNKPLARAMARIARERLSSWRKSRADGSRAA